MQCLDYYTQRPEELVMEYQRRAPVRRYVLEQTPRVRAELDALTAQASGQMLAALEEASRELEEAELCADYLTTYQPRAQEAAEYLRGLGPPPSGGLGFAGYLIGAAAVAVTLAVVGLLTVNKIADTGQAYLQTVEKKVELVREGKAPWEIVAPVGYYAHRSIDALGTLAKWGAAAGAILTLSQLISWMSD